MMMMTMIECRGGGKKVGGSCWDVVVVVVVPADGRNSWPETAVAARRCYCCCPSRW